MFRLPFGPVSLLCLGCLLMLGCGGSRQLQSVSVMPAAADAQNFPGAQVAFAATGTFNKPPSPQPLTNSAISWCVGSAQGVCMGNVNPGATVDANGEAKCVPGFSGTVNILAGKAMVGMNPDGGSQMTVFGTAKLTCP
jgi:hypothetical protein